MAHDIVQIPSVLLSKWRQMKRQLWFTHMAEWQRYRFQKSFLKLEFFKEKNYHRSVVYVEYGLLQSILSIWLMNPILQQIALSESLHFDRDLCQHRSELVYQNNINISCFEGLLFSFSETNWNFRKGKWFHNFLSLYAQQISSIQGVWERTVHIKFCWRTRWKILNNHKLTITTTVVPLRLLCQVAETLCHTDVARWAGIILALCSSFSPGMLSKTVWKLGYGFMWSDSCQNLVSQHRKMVWICHCGDRENLSNSRDM